MQCKAPYHAHQRKSIRKRRARFAPFTKTVKGAAPGAHMVEFGAMYLRWTSYSCPACGAHTESRVVSSPRVGLEYKKCRKCGATYRTPDREWQNMTVGQRRDYFLSEWTVGWIGLFVLVGAFAIDNHWLGGFYGLAAGCIWCAPPWLRKYCWRVKQSLARDLARDRIRAGLGPE